MPNLMMIELGVVAKQIAEMVKPDDPPLRAFALGVAVGAILRCADQFRSDDILSPRPVPRSGRSRR